MLNKIMHFIIIILLSNINASIVGEYRLTGLNVVDYDFCRQSTDIKVIEKSGFSLDSLIVYTIPQGKSIDYDVRDPYPLFALNAAGVDLWVYFAEDGTATVLEGSTYPTENAGEGCFTEEIALPIQEDFSYTANLNSNEFIPVVDILGIESFSPYKGIESGSISITGSSVFDIVPINPTNLTIPFPIDTSSVYNNNNGMIASNTILPGVTGGYIIKSTDMYSFIDYLTYDPQGLFFNENNPPNRPSLYLEWHALDGPVNESGLGDLIGEDEDGDGTDYDSIYGLDKIQITKVYSNDECGVNSYDIAGDHIDNLRAVKYNQCINEGTPESTCNEIADSWINTCIDFDDLEDEGNNLYVMDLSQDPNFNWGGYITWNSILFHQTQDENYLIDDSNENFNSSCMNDDDFSDCSGRIIFEYAPQCIPSFNMRYFMAELEEQCQESDKDDCGVCFGDGIPQGYCDCYFGYKDCNGNCDEDTSNDDLSCFGCDGVANSGLVVDECGLCGGPGAIEYCYDADGDGIGNQNISNIYCPYEVPNNNIWTLDCSSLNNEENIPKEVNILNTYPNPFNPILNINFLISEVANVKINIYDINGKLAQRLLNDIYNPGNHIVNWNASEFSSGTYFIELKLNEQIIVNRVKLIK